MTSVAVSDGVCQLHSYSHIECMPSALMSATGYTRMVAYYQSLLVVSATSGASMQPFKVVSGAHSESVQLQLSVL